MTIPSELQGIINRINDELQRLEGLARNGLEQLRAILNQFPNNDTLVYFFACLNNVLFLVELYQKRVQGIVNLLSPEGVTIEIIQEMGEDLGDLLGRIIETRIETENIVERIKGLE